MSLPNTPRILPRGYANYSENPEEVVRETYRSIKEAHRCVEDFGQCGVVQTSGCQERLPSHGSSKSKGEDSVSNAQHGVQEHIESVLPAESAVVVKFSVTDDELAKSKTTPTFLATKPVCNYSLFGRLKNNMRQVKIELEGSKPCMRVALSRMTGIVIHPFEALT